MNNPCQRIMIKRTFLPHTADVRLKVEADTLEELFEGALQGMGNLLRKGSCNAGFTSQFSQEITVRSVDLTALLIDFLSQVLTLSFEKKAVYCKLTINQINNNILKGRLYGCQVQEFEEDIKAVTYHEANVHQNKAGNWEVIIVFDI